MRIVQKTHGTRRAAERGDSRAYGSLAAPQREKRCSQRLIWRLSLLSPGVRAAARRRLRCRAAGGSGWHSGRRRPRGSNGGSSREMLLLNKFQHLTAAAAPCSPWPTRGSNSRAAAGGYDAVEEQIAALLLPTTRQFVRSWTCGGADRAGWQPDAPGRWVWVTLRGVGAAAKGALNAEKS